MVDLSAAAWTEQSSSVAADVGMESELSLIIGAEEERFKKERTSGGSKSMENQFRIVFLFKRRLF